MDSKFLEKFFKRYNIDDTVTNRELVSELYPYDPSPNKKYLNWLYKKCIDEFGYRAAHYFDHKYWGEVSDNLVVLDNFPQRFKNAGLSTDIYSYPNVSSFAVAAEKAFQRSDKKIQLKHDVDVVDDFDGIIILYPSTAEASCYYGKGTRWCITDEGTYYDYMETGDLFFILNRSSNDDDYKTAIYINVFGKIECFNATDDKLKVSFEDVDRIEYSDDGDKIIYPKRVGSSIKKYMKDIMDEKPKQLISKAFGNWVKSLGEGYEPGIRDINVDTFLLRKRNGVKVRVVGEYVVADDKTLQDLIKGFDVYGIMESSSKTNNLIKVIGEQTLLSYFDWNGLFNEMLIDNRFRFYDEYNIDNLTDEEIEKSPEINKLKKQFMGDPVGFYNDNIYKETVVSQPRHFNHKDLSGMLFIYDSFFNLNKLLEDYPTYCIDAKAQPITWKYNGKDYYIMNISDDNEDVYGK